MKEYFLHVIGNYKNDYGKDLYEKISASYDQTLTDDKGWSTICKIVRQRLAAVTKRYPRCKPFHFTEFVDSAMTDKYGSHPRIVIQKSEGDGTPVVTISTEVVRE